MPDDLNRRFSSVNKSAPRRLSTALIFICNLDNAMRRYWRRGILFDKLSARSHVLTHKHREYGRRQCASLMFTCLSQRFSLDPLSFPKAALPSSHQDLCNAAHSSIIASAKLLNEAAQLVIGPAITLAGLTLCALIQRRCGKIEITIFDNRTRRKNNVINNVAMCAPSTSASVSDDNLMIAQLAADVRCLRLSVPMVTPGARKALVIS